MKLDPVFFVQGNRLIKISDNQTVNPESLKLIDISWAKVELSENSYDEAFLASLREELKALDGQDKYVILSPSIDKKFETPEEIEAFITTVNHTARRLKDCTCIAGVLLPDELLEKGIDSSSPAANLMETLAIKHAQYVYFVKKQSEDKYNLSNAVFFSSLVLL